MSALRRSSSSSPSPAQKAKYDAAMNEFERAMEKMSKSMRKSAVQSIREDERMRQSAREMLIHEAATATTTARRKSLQDISLVSGAAAKVALDRSVERMRRDKHANETSAERAAREAAEAAERKDQQPVFEHLEACTERVLRAELALARRIAQGKSDLHESSRRHLRSLAEEMGEALLPEDDDVRRERDRQLLDSRPQVIDALLSGEGAEIEAAFEVLAGPLILYIRHYSNTLQMVPKLLLIMIGLPIILEQDLKLGSTCKDVLMIGGRPFLPMSAWLLTQIITDIAIVITRARRFYLMRPVVRAAKGPVVLAFDRGEGVEATRLRNRKRSELFTSFLKHNIMKIGRKSKISAGARRGRRNNTFEEDLKGSRTSRRPGELTMNEKNIRGLEDMLDANLSDDGEPPERPRAPSTRARSASVESLESELDEDDAAPPHALDAIIPIEEASERGERALLALARVENSGTRVPLALLTILSFTLGLAGGVYLLLPFGRDSCQPLALVLANSYIAFFYIFFVPNLLICIDILERTMARLDDIFFLGQVPLCTFFAKRLLLKSTAPPLDGARLKALLRRDAYILKHRRETLKTALDDCDEQIAAVDSIRKRARLAYKKKDTIDPFAETPGLRVRRYSRFVPEVSWHQSFVPVYREVDPATPLDGYDPNFPRTAVSPIKLFGNTFRLQSPRRASDAAEGRRDSDASEFEFYDAL
ncbi:hypothetical protein JL721_5516 [Aureococcus anophagefferens]|nr:hypothetical protein JL721_5516 [Aureococcus anophagefferens]